MRRFNESHITERKVMADKSKIEWTEATWNPIRGCSRVSEGCRNCYAESVANRFKGEGQPYEGLIAKGGQWNGEIKFVDHALDQPLRWAKPRRIFVNSMSDLFHENVHESVIHKIFAVMYLAPHHTFQVLTKRPERMANIITNGGSDNGYFYAHVLKAANEIRQKRPHLNLIPIDDPSKFPARHVWLGVSAEDQKTYNDRVWWLAATPAAVRWVSVEPICLSCDEGTLICHDRKDANEKLIFEFDSNIIHASDEVLRKLFRAGGVASD